MKENRIFLQGILYLQLGYVSLTKSSSLVNYVYTNLSDKKVDVCLISYYKRIVYCRRLKILQVHLISRETTFIDPLICIHSRKSDIHFKIINQL